MKKTYRGSCLCGSVAFEADIDLVVGTTKCNCTACWKRRYWGISLEPDSFRLESGEQTVSHGARGGHCRECGINVFVVSTTDGWGIEGLGGDQVSVSVACLDDLPISELLAAPVQYLDGKNDSWHQAPDETRHL